MKVTVSYLPIADLEHLLVCMAEGRAHPVDRWQYANLPSSEQGTFDATGYVLYDLNGLFPRLTTPDELYLVPLRPPLERV